MWPHNAGTASSVSPHAQAQRPAELRVPWHEAATETRVLQFRELVGILRRRLRLLSAIAGFGTAAAVVIALQIPPKYTASAQLVVDPQTGIPGSQTASVTLEEEIETHATLVGSRDHLRRVLDSLTQAPGAGDPTAAGIQSAAPARPEAEASSGPEKPRPTGADEPGPSTSTDPWMAWLAKIRQNLGVWARALGFDGDSRARALERFTRNTLVKQESRSRVITVSVTSKDPEKAATYVNRIAELYVERQRAEKRAYADQQLARLDEKIAALKAEVERSAAAVTMAVQQRVDAAGTGKNQSQSSDGQLRELERRAGASAQLYAALLRRREETRDQRAEIPIGIGIASLASVPTHPSSHNPLLFVLPAFLTLGFAGSLLVVILEQVDDTLRDERDVNEALGVQCSCLIPRLPRRQAARPWELFLTQPASAYCESIRSILAALQTRAGARMPRSLLLTSSISQEGKTTLALSLAVCMARLGRRVLVVDLDFQIASAPSEPGAVAARRIVPPNDQSPPLSEYIQYIPEIGLDYLPMGRWRPDQLALGGGGEQISQLMRQLWEGYDFVVIDGPPLLGVAEARLYPAMADNVLFVIRWGSTRREVAQDAINLLHFAGHFDSESREMPAAVVTQVDLKKHGRFRSGNLGEVLGYKRRSGSYGSDGGTLTADGKEGDRRRREPLREGGCVEKWNS